MPSPASRVTRLPTPSPATSANAAEARTEPGALAATPATPSTVWASERVGTTEPGAEEIASEQNRTAKKPAKKASTKKATTKKGQFHQVSKTTKAVKDVDGASTACAAWRADQPGTVSGQAVRNATPAVTGRGGRQPRHSPGAKTHPWTCPRVFHFGGGRAEGRKGGRGGRAEGRAGTKRAARRGRPSDFRLGQGLSACKHKSPQQHQRTRQA